jgi:hypothetical protein
MGDDLTAQKRQLTCRPKGKISHGCLRKRCSDSQSQKRIVICGINCRRRRRRRRKLCYTEPFLQLCEFFSRLAVEVTMFLFYYSCSTVCINNSHTEFFENPTNGLVAGRHIRCSLFL